MFFIFRMLYNVHFLMIHFSFMGFYESTKKLSTKKKLAESLYNHLKKVKGVFINWGESQEYIVIRTQRNNDLESDKTHFKLNQLVSMIYYIK